MDALSITVVLIVGLFALLVAGMMGDPSSRDYRS